VGERVSLDWMHLPPGIGPRSLWPCLHDATLESVHSDPLERSLSLSLDVSYLREHHGLPEDLRFIFFLSGVRSVRAVTFVHWPGPHPDTSGMSMEEQNRLVGEYQTKGREESVSWTAFEADVVETSFRVSDADLASIDNEIALHVQGFLDEEFWYESFVRAEELTVRRSDNIEFGLNDLCRLGEGYWEQFPGG
jgi:hypothetical protein